MKADSIESSTISALFLCHCWQLLMTFVECYLMTTSLDDVKTSWHAARHIISVEPATVHRVFYIVTDKELSLLCNTDVSEAVRDVAVAALYLLAGIPS